MAKEQFNCRLSGEVKLLIKAEVSRLTVETGQKVTEADVVEMAIVKWCSVEVPKNFEEESVDGDVADNSASDEGGDPSMGYGDKRETARAAMRAAEVGSAAVPMAPKVNKGTESVAQRRAREAKEHAAELAESDVTARLTGRTDIDYDLEHVPHRSVAAPPVNTGDGSEPKPIIQGPPKVYKKNWGPLTRPHGKTEAKRRREQ